MKPMKQREDYTTLVMMVAVIVGLAGYDYYQQATMIEIASLAVVVLSTLIIAALIWAHFFGKNGRERRKRKEIINSLPDGITCQSKSAVKMGRDKELGINVYLPDKIRSRHVHILGATGSGKTESVILNFLKQDITRGLGAVILDAKGDASFLEELNQVVDEAHLKVFDLSDENSLGYDPLMSGNPLESAQRLFSSLQWSEEYYKSKALTALQGIYKYHFEIEEKNPTLKDISHYLESPNTYAMTLAKEGDDESYKGCLREYSDILGLRDQINLLCSGHLEYTLSPEENSIELTEALSGKVLYFRLQSLMSPQLVGTVGRLIINNLNFLAGTTHRKKSQSNDVKLIPTYLDEFASFACPEFADLISKARSAGLALHFSHQSIGDLTAVSPHFLNQITDNAATKIVMRINDPDSAEYFARAFGTKLTQKVTQRVTNTKDTDMAESVGEGSQREVHQFRASPDLFKTLPTGEGAVLIAHGEDAQEGASSTFRVKFPALKEMTSRWSNGRQVSLKEVRT